MDGLRRLAELPTNPAAAPEWLQRPVYGAVSGIAQGLASLPMRALQASEAMRGGYGYDPAPVMEAATTVMSGGMPLATKGALGMAGGRLGGAFDPTQTGWIFKDVAHPNKLMQPGDWRKVTNATETGSGILDVELPIRSLNATQKSVNPDFARPLSGNTESPFVIKKGGQYFVQDGHHRLTAAAEQGNQTAKVRLVDLDGTTQTSFPLVDRMTGKYGIMGGAVTGAAAASQPDQAQASIFKTGPQSYAGPQTINEILR